MRLCISITETELQVAKAALRVNLFESLDGTTQNAAEIGRYAYLLCENLCNFYISKILFSIFNKVT